MKFKIWRMERVECKLIVFFWPECYLCWDEELLHGHHVHVGEVLDHKPLALVQVVVTSTLHKLFKCTLCSNQNDETKKDTH